MAYKKAEPLYGAPRGNRVMAAKRVNGPTARKTLLTHVACEKCSVAGCAEPVLVTRNVSGTLKLRYCAAHIGNTPQVTSVWWLKK